MANGRSSLARAARGRSLLAGAVRILLVAVVLVAWEVVARLTHDGPYIGQPSTIVVKLSSIVARGELFGNLAATTEEMLLGLTAGIVLGTVLGLLLGQWRFLARILEPYLVAMYSLPKLAIAPIFIMWFGIGLKAKIVFVFLVTFFFVFFAVYTGVRQIPADVLNAVRVMGARGLDVVTKVVLPASVAWILSGIKIAIPYSLIGAIGAEIIASDKGLGYLVTQAAGVGDVNGVLAALVPILAVSVVLNGVAVRLDTHLLRWR